ncbi:GAF domain-containing protein [Luteolibacter algae]|uniref:histidine kinase n=1 Tax=Luteolibacter algae TaxID=454151 RepID=A0ABW5D5Q6_9BACT
MEYRGGSNVCSEKPSFSGDEFSRAHAELLEMILKEVPLGEILRHVALLIEGQSPVKTWCSVILLAGSPPVMKLAAAPSIPVDFIDRLRTLHTAPTDGTCGKAIVTGNTVIVEDVLAAEGYEKFRDLSRNSGVRASWTIPVFGSSGQVIATITCFYHAPHKPSAEELRKVEDMRNLIGLAIEKTRAAEELVRSNKLFQSIASATNDAVWDWDITTNNVWWNEGFCKLFGYSGTGNGPTYDEWKARIHPEDRERVCESLIPPSKGQQKRWVVEYRFFHQNGNITHVIDKAEVIFDNNGKAVRMIGGMTDMTSQREIQSELVSLNRALQMLRACNHVLIHATNEDDLLTKICEVAIEIGGYSTAWVGYADRGPKKMIIPAATVGYKTDFINELELTYDESIPSGNTPGGTTIRTGKAVTWTDISTDALDFIHKPRTVKLGYRGLVCLPLRDENKCFGFLSLLSREVNAVSEQELNLLQELADNLAFGIIALRNRISEETTRDVIVKVAQTVSDASGQNFYELLAVNMVEALGADAGLIGRIDPNTYTVNSLSFVLDGVVQENVTYSLHDTPCEQTDYPGVCLFDQGVRELFPNDHALVEMGIDSYAGISLFSDKGERFGILSVLFKKPIGEPALVRSVLKIFADRAASEMTKEQSNALMIEQASLLDKARDAIFTCDLDHRIGFWNKSAERLYGRKGSAVIGLSARDLLHDNPESFDLAYKYAIEQGEWLGELHQIDKRGRPIIVESRWNLVRDEKGKPVSILSINTDITGHKHLEQQFLRAQRLESIGTLAGGLAHDLNNVLAPISMSIELLRKSISDARGNELLDTIAQSSHRGAEMVGQILSFARGIDGRRVKVSGSEVIAELSAIIRDSFPKSIRTETRLVADLWPILGDATQIHQVLLNLCVNARDAMPEGGNLYISASNQDINENYVAANIDAKPGPYVCIEVEDTGEGISPEIIGKIYDPFFTTKEIGKGTGLGLSTTLAIVKSHGGFIKSYSEPGKGTGFRVYIPAMVEFSDAESENNSLEHPEGNGELILLIDDETAILKMTRRILETFGYKTLTAGSGTKGVEIFRERHREIDIVLTDMVMPGMDGKATIQALLEIDKDAQIIAVSGIRSNGEVAQSYSKGVRNFLQKPFTANTLLQCLNSILHHS